MPILQLLHWALVEDEAAEAVGDLQERWGQLRGAQALHADHILRAGCWEWEGETLPGWEVSPDALPRKVVIIHLF